ncbi:MAG: chemotaxis response regulator protein-glutamate methylesterase [Proteobacteria bacterium]|nr:chemotaxis response regulator protein-glutamate methylesterase [Pseudomonadota bacterium]
MGKMIRVLIVDDSAFMRNILERMIKEHSGMEVVGKAENGLVATEMVKELDPDVVTLDIEMPKMDGLQALSIIMRESPCPVIMVSSLTEKGASETMKALDLGAIDFIPKALGDASGNIFTKKEYVQNKIVEAFQAKDSIKRLSTQSIVNQTSRVAESTNTPKENSNTAFFQRRRHKTEKNLVLIGSSTGGPKALSDIISKLRKNLEVPVVIAQHMPEGFTSALSDRLNRNFPISVKEAENGEELKAGCVYIAQGGKHIRVQNKMNKLYIDVDEDNGESPFKPSVDVLAESVHKAVGASCLAVMLTGMGSDGSREFKKLKELGAYVVTQSEETCTVYGMPKSVVELGASSEQAAVTEIPNIINSMIK